MIAELREMLRLDDLDLNYDVKIVDFDGESFTYNAKATDCDVEELAEKIKETLAELIEDPEIGYIDISEEEDKVCVYHDTGNCDDPLKAVHTVLNTINDVSEVQTVIINEL